MGMNTFTTPSLAGVFAVRGCGLERVAVWTADVGAMAGTAAASRGTGLPTAVRLRVPAVIGSHDALPSVPVRGIDVPMTGLPVQGRRTASSKQYGTTPGDLPPRDPLS